MNAITQADIQAAKSVPIDQEVGRVVTWDRKRSLPAKGDLWAACPFHNERSPSFHVVVADGFYKCFGCGQAGDVIQFVRAYHNVDFPTAVNMLLGRVGADPAARASAAARYRADQEAAARRAAVADMRKLEKARSLVARSRPIAGSLVQDYLLSRGLDISVLGTPVDLGVINGLEYWTGRHAEAQLIGHFPAMVAAMRNAAGDVCAAHVTYLAKDGSGKAEIVDPETGELLAVKKMQGLPWGCAIRLYPVQDIVAISEGIESGLSVRVVDPDLPIWVAGSLGNLAGAGERQMRRMGQRQVPSNKPDPANPGLVAPDAARTVIIIADNDSTDVATNRALVLRARAKFEAQGKSVGVVWPERGCDANDMVRADGVRA